MTTGDLVIKLIIDGKNATATIEDVDGKLDKLEDTGKKSTKSISTGFSKVKMGAFAAAAAIAGIIKGLNSAVNVTSEYMEANSKLMTVFTGVQSEAAAMRDTLVESYDMSRKEATKLLGATGDLLTGLGMQADTALDLSGTTQQLAVDLASFNDVAGGAAAVSDALTKAMLGERESLTTYGIKIGEADVKQQLLLEGKQNLTGQAKRQAVAEATLTLALQQSKNAIGDHARTANSYANIRRRLANKTENFALMMGAVFIPVWKEALKLVESFFDWMRANKVFGILAGAWSVIKDFAVRIYNLFANLGELILNVFKGNWSGIKQNLDGMWQAIGEGWENTVKEMVDAEKGAEAEIDALLNTRIDREAEAEAKRKMIMQRQIQHLQNVARMEVAITKKAENAKLIDTKKAGAARVKSYEELARQELALEFQKVQGVASLGGQLMNAYQGQSKAMFNVGKAASIASAIMDTISASIKAFKNFGGWPTGLIPAATTLALGYARVSQIRSTSYRPPAKASAAKIEKRAFGKGGLVTEPTMGLLGETGETEIIAPQKTFIQVVKDMLAAGDFTGGNINNNLMPSVLDSFTSKMDDIVEHIRNLELKVEMSAEEMALIVRRGDNYIKQNELIPNTV